MEYKVSVPDSIAPEDAVTLENMLIEITMPLDSFFFKTVIADPNFKVVSENEADLSHIFLNLDVELDLTGDTFTFFISGEEGLDFGPFTAGQEGELIISGDEIIMDAITHVSDDLAIPANFVCNPREDTDPTIATIPIDNEAPVITLKGDNPMIMKQGDEFVDPGATAEDNFDGDVSDNIDVSGVDEVDTDTIGEYTVTYTVSDSVGNEATETRTVEVVEPFGEWYTGDGAPSDELGSNGDSYLDIASGDIYKRDPNTWTKIGNLKGDDGKQGSAILTGSGAPSSDAGAVGDLYLDTNSGDVYEKTADGWKKIANLEGPAGPQGPKGSDGAGGGNDDKQSGGKKVSAKDNGDSKSKSAEGGKLPKTATNLPTLMLIGTLLATAGGVLFLRRRKAIE